MVSVHEYYLYETIDINKLINSKGFIQAYQNKINLMKQSLIKVKVDIDKIEKIVEKHAIAAAEAVKKKDTRAFGEVVKEMFSEIGETGIFRELTVSVVLVLIVVIIHQFLLGFLIGGLGWTPMAALALLAIFIAPLTEETGKFLSVKYGASGMHYIIFNLVEFIGYFIQGVMLGVPAVAMFIARLVTAFTHLLLTTLHIRGKKEGDEKARFMAAAGIHSVWNFFAMLPAILQNL